MRLYYGFVTCISGWIGISYFQYLNQTISFKRKVYISLLLFLSWGVNQIINDFLGIKEDRINAPNRPMVNGSLKQKPALFLTAFWIGVMLLLCYRLHYLSLIPAISGIIFNIIYEYAKGYSILGNIVFGIMIAMCPIFGFLASGDSNTNLDIFHILAVLILMILQSGIMTYFTYFKDYKGDKLEHKNTFIVKYGIKRAKFFGMFLSISLIIFFLIFIKLKWILLRNIIYKREFFFCGVIAIFLNIWTACAFFRNPTGKETYYNLRINIRACCAGYATLISLYEGIVGLYLLTSSYILIGFLFSFHKDEHS